MIGRIGIIICNAYTTIWPIVVSPDLQIRFCISQFPVRQH